MARQRMDLPREFPDHAIREALVQPDNLRAVVREAVPSIADRLDYSRAHVEPRTFLLDDWREREVDVLVRLPLLHGEGLEVLVYILVEHWTTPDQAMPLRMLLFAVQLWEKEWRAWHADHDRGQPLRLTPIVPIVLHTGERAWNVPRTIAELFSGPEELRAFAPAWGTPLWDLPAHDARELIATDEPWLQFLAVVRNEHAEAAVFVETTEEVMRRLQALATTNPIRWQQLAKMILGWAMLRRPRAEWERVLEAIRRSQENAELLAEVEHMAEQTQMTWEQELLGRGRSLGSLETSRDILKTQLQQKFGSLPEELLRRINTADLSALQTALAQVVTITSLDQVRI